ncbi:unnamed protein product [Toxocara canis]|uniref:Uncharacterized protein n=1 Tax=Toxocara canis TaxID=6265 RepID=A0A183U591_TOXCA|nr:unnamed protein product [Toxocara canis]
MALERETYTRPLLSLCVFRMRDSPGRNELKWRRVPREQQLNVGQSALRNWLMPCVIERRSSNPSRLSKGKRVNIPVPGHGDKRSLRAFSAATQTNSVTLNRARARVLFSS